MSNFKKILIILFSVFFLLSGIIALNHFHSERVFQGKDKHNCSICAFLSTISNAAISLFVFLVIFASVFINTLKNQLSFVKKCIYLPPSLAPPVLA